MSALSLNSVILMTMTTVVVSHAAFTGTTASDDGPGSDFRLVVKRDVNYNENDSESEEGKHNDDKPDFITTFDIIRLLDEKYAMKQFYCVINEDPCDSVGMRLKATIPEEINRDCERCTSTETNNIRRILNYVKKHYPEFWERVEPIYRNNKTV